MPLNTGDLRWQRAENRVIGGTGRRMWGAQADIGDRHQPDRTTGCLGKQLVAEAEAEIGAAGGKPAADCLFLDGKPRQAVFLPHIHRSATDQQRIPRGEILRRQFACIEFDHVQGDAVACQEVAEDAGVFAVQMLKHQHSAGSDGGGG